MEYKKLLETLPKSWNDVKLKDYLRLTTLEDIDTPEGIITTELDEHLTGIDTSLALLSKLLEVSTDELELIPMIQMLELINQVSFLNTLPEAGKSKLQLKKIDELTYSDWVAYENLMKEPFQNMAALLSIFDRDKKEPEYYLNLPMPDVINSFFLLKKNSVKYMKSLKVSLLKKIAKQRMKEGLKTLMQYFQNHKI